MKSSHFEKAIKNIFNHKRGRCNICGNRSYFFCSSIEKARNGMICLFCGSCSRNRHVAQILLKERYPKKTAIKNIVEQGQKIYLLGTAGPFNKTLGGKEFFVQSELIDGVPLGKEVADRVFCQNVENLTFEDSFFDVVISEDVFEHVRLDMKGFSEVYRVLKKGGHHIFTIPCHFDRKTAERVDTSGPLDVNILPEEYHGDPVRGRILAYRNYGIDLFEKLDKLGFSTELFLSKYEDEKLGIFDSYVFLSRKL